MAKPTGKNRADEQGITDVDLKPALRTLTDLKRDLGAIDQSFHEEEFGSVPADVLLSLGKRAASADIIASAPQFVSDSRKSWDGLTKAQRKKVVGFAPEYLPILVEETLRLEQVHRRVVAQDTGVAVEVGKRRRALTAAVSSGVVLRDQCARALRRRVRGNAQVVEAIEAATGTADEPAKLVAGLNLLAQTLTDQRKAATAATRAAWDKVGLGAEYAERLRAEANAVVAAEGEANAAADNVVTQDELDQQDGRVLHLVDCVYRAFKDASRLIPGLAVPSLGALESAIAPKAAASKREAEEGGGGGEGGEGGGGGGGGPQPA